MSSGVCSDEREVERERCRECGEKECKEEEEKRKIMRKRRRKRRGIGMGKGGNGGWK